jgi:hypothetical protein
MISKYKGIHNMLYNGIELPQEWPPRTEKPASFQPMRVPYLETPPAIIPIDVGRQLFVDDFLVASSSMVRTFHSPVKYPGNPVWFPQTPYELNETLPPTAIPKCGGVWYDERDQLFKMWYMASYLGAMAYATSTDGIHWERPELDVVPGTNLILSPDLHPDSGTVWLDRETRDDSQRFKMLIREPNTQIKGNYFPGLLMTSSDGIHWSPPVETGPMHDRSTFFYNPFRHRWVQSIRSWIPPRNRTRQYWEAEAFYASGQWRDGEQIFWAGADGMDESGEAPAELYNLDAVAYESLLIGFYQILKGPPNVIGENNGQPKLTELVFASSRDGFHWHRPDRRAFIGARREPGSWEYGYVESTGGICLVVCDELWFYYSAYAGDPKRVSADWHVSGMYGNGAVGLAKLRRDGFASMRSKIPGASFTTRPLRFSGGHLFVNANTAGAPLTVECLDENNQVIAPFDKERCLPFLGNSMATEIHWREADLKMLAGQPVRFRFQSDRGDLYAFWVSPNSTGVSGGYPAAGGPGWKG